MLENKFKTNLCNKIKQMFPDCMIEHLNPNNKQGIPDLLILNGPKWGVLEGKKTANSSHRPNQDYYVDKMNKMSFARFIYPENEEVVLHELQQALGIENRSCPVRS